ncbi:Mastermind-like protein 3 [Pteropus alecto]|uniref:Mastermind-like protein 3 n=1 Tax=Pteropus alecto TaxID=9402 RepID=L5L2H4_PTEAL|nr:Mastermind-like protein 3 [Pteropus alecto]
MGDFAAPAAAANGSSICINSSLNSSLGGAGIAVNNTPNSTPAAPSSNHPAAGCGGGGSAGPGGASAAVPKHSTVVERLRQRIEGCRRHHVNCENRYQQAQVEQLELERRDTVSLYQRTLEQRAKKSGAGTGKQQHQSKPQQDAEAASAEQRNHTLIMCDASVRGRRAVGIGERRAPSPVLLAHRTAIGGAGPGAGGPRGVRWIIAHVRGRESSAPGVVRCRRGLAPGAR